MSFFRRFRNKSTIPGTATFYDYSDDEKPVYSTRHLGEIKQGVSYKISGYMPLYCQRFAIDLILDSLARDIALRVNPRLPQNYIVRNSRIKSYWGFDEDSSVLPFTLKRGANFAIQILITDQRYMISLNGCHFAKYNHRLPYKSLASIEVHGDVNNIRVDRTEETEYPEFQEKNNIRIPSKDQGSNAITPLSSRTTLKVNTEASLPLPYYGLLPQSLIYGKHLRFEGRVKLLPWSFYINLQSGQNLWPHPIVAFHFRCRFSKHRDYIGRNVIAQNAWYNDKWAKEEVFELTTDLCPAKSFSLVISRGLVSYQVYVNKSFITEYRFRVEPNTVDTVYVLGDIRLWDVVLEDHDEANFTRISQSSAD